MRSKRISAREALDWGIATECVPDTHLEAAADALLRSFSPLAQRTAKKLLNGNPLGRNRPRGPLLQPATSIRRLARRC
jgi:enoyl-CoA hydratase/carnithine racemase